MFAEGPGASADCQLQQLTVRGRELKPGDAAVDLGEADAARNAGAWQGPLVTGACTLDLGITEMPLIHASATLL